jgi:hypothetical protein
MRRQLVADIVLVRELDDVFLGSVFSMVAGTAMPVAVRVAWCRCPLN